MGVSLTTPIVEAGLSSREWAVMLRLARGERATDIAADLRLNIKTVSTYRRRIFDKTGLDNNVALALAVREQQVPFEYQITPKPPASNALNGKEERLLDLIGACHPNKTIAALLFRTPNAINSQKKKLARKLGLSSAHALKRYAYLRQVDISPSLAIVGGR